MTRFKIGDKVKFAHGDRWFTAQVDEIDAYQYWGKLLDKGTFGTYTDDDVRIGFRIILGRLSDDAHLELLEEEKSMTTFTKGDPVFATGAYSGAEYEGLYDGDRSILVTKVVSSDGPNNVGALATVENIRPRTVGPALIGPRPEAPKTPAFTTPFEVGAGYDRDEVYDSRGNHVLSVRSEDATIPQAYALAKVLVDLLNEKYGAPQ